MDASARTDAGEGAIARDLLAWYDAAARDLPWRYRNGEQPDPYRVWLSEVMLQQTTVAAVRPKFEAWIARWPTVTALAAADDGEIMAAWAGLGYYARARNVVKTARTVAARGSFPRTERDLRDLPGLGAYTAAAVAAIAFGERAVVVDTNVERVVARLFAIATPLPMARPEIRAAADRITPAARAGDFAQAMMDLGATICTPRVPRCLLCPVRTHCVGRATGVAEQLPLKVPKRARPKRFGTIFWVERGDCVLLVRRPDDGLLGGMRALPTGGWTNTEGGLEGAPVEADWRLSGQRVAHGFTHFDLVLSLAIAKAPADVAVAGEWWPLASLDTAGLPTLFAKAAAAIMDDR